jgi:hypothetical protein
MHEQNSATEMEALGHRAEKLVNALANAYMSAAEVAAEKIELASRVAQVRMRMTAFGAVLESIGAAKQPLLERLRTAGGPMKALLGYQIEVLTAQELAILEKVGVEPQQARNALTAVDTVRHYVRDGRRFRAVEGDTNGVHAQANGTEGR